MLDTAILYATLSTSEAHQSDISFPADLEVTLSNGSHVPNLQDELKSAASRVSEQEAGTYRTVLSLPEPHLE